MSISSSSAVAGLVIKLTYRRQFFMVSLLFFLSVCPFLPIHTQQVSPLGSRKYSIEIWCLDSGLYLPE
jgi:hypothetical protein